MSDAARPDSAPSLAALLRQLNAEGHISEEVIRDSTDDAEVADALVELTRRSNTLRRRSTELRAVMSSTRDLLAITDTELLLQRIVERAHELMDLDMAYLSVYDENSQELLVRAATGVTSPRFLNMVVPPGIGLASLAASTGRPQWVEDYSQLSNLPRDPIIDEIVGEEQLSSLLGAPLVVAGRVLGVLFSANRTSHVFVPEEVSLLTIFADHAALVLHRTNLLREANNATAQAATRQQEAEWAASLHEQFTRLAVDSQNASAIVASLARALGRDAALIDDQKVLFASGPADHHLLLTGSALTGKSLTGQTVRLESGPAELLVPLVTATGQPQALVIARGATPLTPVQQRTVERTALLAALIALRQDALTHAEEEVRGELASELFEGPSRDAGLQRAASRGFHVERPWMFLAIGCESRNRATVLSRLHQELGWLAISTSTGVSVLAPGDDPQDTSRRVSELVGQHADLILTVVASDLRSAAESADSTWMALSLAQGLGLKKGVHSASSLAPYTSLFEGDGSRLARYIDELLAPVLEWDRLHGTSLLDTLSSLFDSQWNLSATSREMHLHVNTVKQRVTRLRLLLGPDLDRPESRFRLELAARAELTRRYLK